MNFKEYMVESKISDQMSKELKALQKEKWSLEKQIVELERGITKQITKERDQLQNDLPKKYQGLDPKGVLEIYKSILSKNKNFKKVSNNREGGLTVHDPLGVDVGWLREQSKKLPWPFMLEAGDNRGSIYHDTKKIKVSLSKGVQGKINKSAKLYN